MSGEGGWPNGTVRKHRGPVILYFLFILQPLSQPAVQLRVVFMRLFEFLRFGLVLLEVTELQSEMFVYGLVSTL